jgi:hypothetical protein
MHLVQQFFRLTLTLSFLHGTAAQGQEAAAPEPVPGPPAAAPASNQPVPKLPLIPRASALAEWTVRITENFTDNWETSSAWEAPVEGQRVINSVQIAKDEARKTYRMRTHWNNGDKEDEWIVMGNHVAERPGGRGYYIVGAEASTAADLSRSDFSELSWVGMSSYRGLKKFKGKVVFAFELPFDQKKLSFEEASLVAAAQATDKTVRPSKILNAKVKNVVLYLDPLTQLPILYNDGRSIRTYSFSQSPGPLSAPAEVLDFLRARAEVLRRTLASPSGPGTP